VLERQNLHAGRKSMNLKDGDRLFMTPRPRLKTPDCQSELLLSDVHVMF